MTGVTPRANLTAERSNEKWIKCINHYSVTHKERNHYRLYDWQPTRFWRLCAFPIENKQFSRFQAFAVIWILYIFFWVFPRRQCIICRRFGTMCQFHLQRLEVDCLLPAFEDGTDTWFRNVGKLHIDAGEIPKRTYTIIFLCTPICACPKNTHIYWCENNSIYMSTFCTFVLQNYLVGHTRCSLATEQIHPISK